MLAMLAVAPPPLKTAYTSWIPETPEAGAETVCQFCHPPLTGSVTEAINGPVALSRWNSTVPPLPSLAVRTLTVPTEDPKFTFL